MAKKKPPWTPPDPYGGFTPSTLPPAPKPRAKQKPTTVRVKTGDTTQVRTQFGPVGKPTDNYTTVNASTRPDDRGAVRGTVPGKPRPRVKQMTRVLPASHPAQVSAAAAPAQVAAPAVSVKPRVPKAPKQKQLPATHDRPPRRPTGIPRAAAPQLTPEQEAGQLLAPQYKVLDTQEQQREAALKAFSDAMIRQLQGAPAQIAGDYRTAQNSINGYAQTAANGLAAANPNDQTQALLSAIGAPDAQKQQVTDQNRNVFTGGGAVLYDTSGAIPASQTAADQASALLYARSLPSIQGLASLQGLRGFQQQNALARQQIGAQAPELAQRISAARQDAFYKQQALDQNAAALGIKTKQQQFDNNVTLTKLQMSVDKYNATQTTKNRKIDAQVSKGINDGFAHNSDGSIVYSAGKPLSFHGGTVSTKTPSPSQIGTLVDRWKNGKVQNVNVQQPNADQNGNPVYRSVSTQTGQINFGQAYKRLRAMGLGDVQARKYLDTSYRRGEQGRGWLSNEERAALGRAGLSNKARLIQGHGVLNAAQVAALTRAGKLPPGIQSTGGYVISQTY